jgi:hypothetical protein
LTSASPRASSRRASIERAFFTPSFRIALMTSWLEPLSIPLRIRRLSYSESRVLIEIGGSSPVTRVMPCRFPTGDSAS